MIINSELAYRKLRCNVHDSNRDVLRAARNLPRFDRLSREGRRKLFIGVLKHHQAARAAWYTVR